MRISGRKARLAAILAAALAAALGFAYAQPLLVLETTGETLLWLQGVRSARVKAGPYELRYLEAGDGPPLVLLHGLGSSALMEWGRLIPPLARRYHVYVPDLPGYGRSERPKDATYSIPMQVDAVRAFMAGVGVARARLAGISMGGWIAARLAVAHPERVERLVLVAPAGMRPDHAAAIPVDVLLPRDVAGVRRLMATVRHKPPTFPDFLARDILEGKTRDEWIVRRALESMGEGHDWLDGTLGAITAPVLVVWGVQDRLIPVADAARIQAELTQARVERLDGCGHVPIADCPEAFDRLLFDFLAAPTTELAGGAP